MRIVVRRVAAVLLEFPAALQAAHLLACKCRAGLQTACRCCLFYALRPRVRTGRGFNSNVSLSKQNAHHKGELFVLMVEAAGIGYPSQPMRLHAHCRSRARSSAARIPHSPRVRTGREFNFHTTST